MHKLRNLLGAYSLLYIKIYVVFVSIVLPLLNDGGPPVS